MERFLSCAIVVAIILNLATDTCTKTFEEDLTLTREQKLILDKFKLRVTDRMPHEYMKHEAFLIRWLRGRGIINLSTLGCITQGLLGSRRFNLAEAEKLLIDHIKWRKENHMDTIFEEDWTYWDKKYRYYLDGRDKEGKPLLYVNAGVWDLRRAAVSGKRAKFLRFIDKGLEEACGLVRELGQKYKNVSQGILILNIDGFNLIQHGCLQCIAILLRVIVQYQAHHPGCADKIILLNMPSIAEPILQTARQALDSETNAALQIHGTNKKKWRTALREYFEADQLPPELGGTKIYKGMSDYDYD